MIVLVVYQKKSKQSTSMLCCVICVSFPLHIGIALVYHTYYLSSSIITLSCSVYPLQGQVNIQLMKSRRTLPSHHMSM